MADIIKTVAPRREVTTMKTFANATLGGLETAYNAYVVTMSADTAFTWTVRIVNSFWDGANFICIAEASYPESNNNPIGQVPLLP